MSIFKRKSKAILDSADPKRKNYGILTKRLRLKQKKNRYKVTCHLTLNNAEPRKVEVLTTAFSRRQAVEKVNETVKFTAVSANKLRK